MALPILYISYYKLRLNGAPQVKANRRNSSNGCYTFCSQCYDNKRRQTTIQTTIPTTIPTTTFFQSTNDSFSIQVPRGWVIQDRNNTGLTLATEVLQGYGVLAELCPAEQQQEALLINAGGNTSNISNSTNNGNSCQRAQEVIH